MTPEDARYAAMKSFSRVDQSREECRDARGVGFIENLMRDVSYSLRVLLEKRVHAFISRDNDQKVKAGIEQALAARRRASAP